ncbi:hypothetical protein V8C86DRAFT_2858727, partial [Haematococcus lacustris]
ATPLSKVCLLHFFACLSYCGCGPSALHRWPACSAEAVLAAVNLTVRGVAITSTLSVSLHFPNSLR